LNKVLVTGGFGYLGSRLAQHLTRVSGKQVVLGTRGQVAAPDWLENAAVVETRWQSDTALGDMCKGIDAVVHLAGMNAPDCAADPVGALESNGLATARLLRASVHAGVKRFVYVSTAHVYGSPLQGTISEQTCTTSRHPYATSHRAGEDAVLHAQERAHIQGIVIRLSNAFGAPANPRSHCWMLLVNDLCLQAVRTRTMELRSSGLQRRDFITLSDACSAIAHLLGLQTASLGDGLFNVGGNWAPTVREMTDRIQACCETQRGYRPEILRPEPGSGETVLELRYGIEKLVRTGFGLSGDVDAEIAATFEVCAAQRQLAHRDS
jgi:UDP-glucose 4-epimerase